MPSGCNEEHLGYKCQLNPKYSIILNERALCELQREAFNLGGLIFTCWNYTGVALLLLLLRPFKINR